MKISGYNRYNQPLAQSNFTKESMNLACPPLDFSLDPSTLLSFSTYGEHSVWVTKDNKAYAIGNNYAGRISCYLKNEIFTTPVEIIIPDSKKNPMKFLSAACGFFYTLYMCYTTQEDGNQSQPFLVLFSSHRNKNEYNNQPLILDIGNHIPIGLFAGCRRAAIIDEEGCVFSPIPHESDEYDVYTPSLFVRYKLPNNEKAISVACCNNFLVVLSNRGKVFANGSFNLQSKTSPEGIHFVRINEFRGIRIVQISGTYDHCIAVSDDGRVFVIGANNSSQLGLGNMIDKMRNELSIVNRLDWFNKFTQLISSKFENSSKIVNSFAGRDFSFFVTSEGKLLACGSNYYRQLFGDNSDGVKELYETPVETTLNSNVSFVIAGNNLSVAFVGCEPCKNMPNLPIGNVVEETMESLEVKLSILQAQLEEKEHLIQILKNRNKDDS